MRVPDGYRVNRGYAAHSACPRCGAMLAVLSSPVRFTSPTRIADDDREVTERVGDGFKGETRVRAYEHAATLRCPRCDRVWSPAQAVRRDFSDGELPSDFLVPDTGVEATADVLRRIVAGLRAGGPRRPPAAPPAAAGQPSLFGDDDG